MKPPQSREETINVLRDTLNAVGFATMSDEDLREEERLGNGYAPTILRARALLSRLEAGSGEETDEVGWWHYSINYGPDGEENYANVYTPTGKFVGNLRISHARDIVGGLNAAKAARPHVATPAPGENSERAEASGADLIDALLDASNNYESAVDISTQRSLRGKFLKAKQALLDHIVHMTAGRRSMREEAAKVAAGTKRAVTSDYSDGWADACERIERAIRAIPEKQS